MIKKVGARSYIVKAANGQLYRRTRKHLRQTTERPIETSITAEACVEDEMTIPITTELQQANENK